MGIIHGFFEAETVPCKCGKSMSLDIEALLDHGNLGLFFRENASQLVKYFPTGHS